MQLLILWILILLGNCFMLGRYRAKGEGVPISVKGGVFVSVISILSYGAQLVAQYRSTAAIALARTTQACSQTEDLASTIDACTKLIGQARNVAFAYNNRGFAFRAKKDTNRAMADFNKSIGTNPRFAMAYVNRGSVYQEQGNLDLAMRDFNAAIGIDPKLAAAYLNRADVSLARRDIDHALYDYNMTVELNPKLAIAYNNRGLAHHFKDNLDQAIMDYSKAIELQSVKFAPVGDKQQVVRNTDLALVYGNRGSAYQAKGELDRAIRDYDNALLFNPNTAVDLYARGLAKWKKGDERGGNEDIAAGKAIQADVAKVFANFWRK